jgi:hypothetical protein
MTLDLCDEVDEDMQILRVQIDTLA